MANFFSSGYADPLAQSFIIPQEFTNGAFVTSVDLFFAATGGETLPVFVQICEMNNGLPTQNVIQNATAILTSSDISTSTDSKTATNCKFQSLVYLKPNTEYCLKVLSNSIKYKVWISQMGEKRVDKAIVISEQPSTGSLFKSQNNSTWSPDQLQDLKFRLYYAKFDVSRSATVQVSNSPISLTATLPPNPFSITNGSAVVIVYHPNHGLFEGRLVTYSGVVSGGSAYANLNTQLTIHAVIDSDHYAVTMGSNAASTDLIGGSAVVCSKSIKFDSFNIQSSEYLPTNTGIDYTARFTSSTSKDTVYTKYKAGVFEPLTQPKYVYSRENEQVFLSGDKSLDVLIDMYSTDPTVSPIINSESLGIALVSNKIDSRTTTIEGIAAVAESVASGNTLESRYISAPVTLATTATDLKFLFAANIQYPSTIELWYRTTMNSSSNPLNTIAWTQVPLSLENLNGLSYTDIEKDVVATQVFTTYQAKIVFKSTNSAMVPRIKDFRIIALS